MRSEHAVKLQNYNRATLAIDFSSIHLRRNMSDENESSSSSESDMGQPNWELLRENLGENAMSALQEHLNGAPSQPKTTNAVPLNKKSGQEIHETNTEEASKNKPSYENKDGSYLPQNNIVYSRKEYWEERFANETDFEWLVSYKDVAPQLQPFLVSTTSTNSKPKLLIVGCGNSSFSSDLYDDGYTQIINIDYSTNVIEKMREKHSQMRPSMTWEVMDMTNMSAFDSESFDIVIDKAAMDAIMTEEGDPWNPDEKVITMSRNMCEHITRVLKPGGYHLHISFAQPHFRKRYLLGLHENNQLDYKNEKLELDVDEEEFVATCTNNGLQYSKEFKWSFKTEEIGGDQSNGCFHHFLYIMQKIK